MEEGMRMTDAQRENVKIILFSNEMSRTRTHHELQKKFD
jgi:hypothetical protein